MQKRDACLVNTIAARNMQMLVSTKYAFSLSFFFIIFFFLQEREEKFRNISEQTNSNILWWAVAQTFILISIGIWQIKSLKDFFIAKKLV